MTILIYIFYIIYINFISLDFSQKKIVLKHHEALNSKKPQGIVLGGSNAIFGISAKTLSQELNFPIINLSLRAEGFSNENYRNYIRTIIKSKNDIKLVIYSSMQYSTYIKQNSDKDIFYIPKYLKIIPESQFANFLFVNMRLLLTNQKLSFQDRENYIVNDYGDIIHDSVDCGYSGSGKLFKMLDFDTVVKNVNDQVSFLKQEFPLADIYFVFPSEFLHNHKDMKSFFERVSRSIELPKSVHLIIDLTQLSMDHICDIEHHPNILGRDLRTKYLLNFIYR
jgi:hypothetical protein